MKSRGVGYWIENHLISLGVLSTLRKCTKAVDRRPSVFENQKTCGFRFSENGVKISERGAPYSDIMIWRRGIIVGVHICDREAQLISFINV